MAQTKQGAIKIAAKKAGLTVPEYLQRISCGQKKCCRCKEWKPLEAFSKNKKQQLGRNGICRNCFMNQRTRSGPPIPDRREKKLMGLGWCGPCAKWFPLGEVRNGRCAECIRSYTNARYASSEIVRDSVKRRVRLRKRGVLPVSRGLAEFLNRRFRGLCAYCRRKKATAFDHVFPVVRGGRTTDHNMLPVCTSCNSSKNDSLLPEWLEKKGLQLDPLAREWISGER